MYGPKGTRHDNFRSCWFVHLLQPPGRIETSHEHTDTDRCAAFNEPEVALSVTLDGHFARFEALICT